MTRTILVTGGAGFVGSHLIQRLLDETDWSVISVDSFTGGGTFFNLLEGCDWDRDRVTSITHDLTVPFNDSHVRVLDARGVDAVVNLASRSHVDESIANPSFFASNNTQLMLNVLWLGVVLGHLDRFLHLSTDEVYGPRQPASPTDYRPSSPYAASKAAQETLALAWQRTYELPVTIVNSANMIGERQRDDAFLPLVVRTLKAQGTVGVHAVGGQVGRRHYSYVGNVVDELLAELRREHPSERLWLDGQTTLTNVQLVERVAELLGVEPRWQFVEATQARPGYDPYYPQLTSDWTPREPFDDALARVVDWYLDD